jgi:ADP-ribosylglycohydrolase
VHDVLDPRDLVPDEAEQLASSGYDVGPLLEDARRAAEAADLEALDAIAKQLAGVDRRPGWPYREPSDEAAILAETPGGGPLRVDRSELPGRLFGAWLGRCVGNTMGKPVEGLPRAEVEAYLRAAGQWPQTGYIPLLAELPAGVSGLHWSAGESAAGVFDAVPRDDDLDWTILGLHILERYGDELTTLDIAKEWLDRLPFTQTYTAERAAYRNLVRGESIPHTATVGNPYREWIGALIRADIFGYTHPGDPTTAARLALVDARLSHVGNGLYGAMWAAALVAAAFATTDARTALEVAVRHVPSASRLAEAQAGLLRLHQDGAGADAALDWVHDRLGAYNWVHTVNNAALIGLGLLWGRDFTSSVALAVSGGWDTDSTAATVGSVYGALHGDGSVPHDLVAPTHGRVRSAVLGFDGIAISELAARTERLASAPGATA